MYKNGDHNDHNVNNLSFKLQILKNEYNLKCKIKRGSGQFMNKKVHTNIYLNCTTVAIQLAIFYERNTFLWIGADERKALKLKWFGDTPRAINT